VCQQFKVSGRVQGVFFRDSTREIANSLGLQGHAINLADGSVEVVACGGENALVRLEQWLQDGPLMASVDAVERIDMECVQPVAFRTG